MIDPTLKEPGVIIAEVRMSAAAGKAKHLLVEGPTDSEFWRSYCASDAEIVICGGKANAETALDGLDRRGLVGIIAIVDDDMDSLLARADRSDNMISTEEHDLEAMVFSSPALDASIAELIDPTLLSAYEARAGATFRASLVERGLCFGRLRFIAKANGLGVNFKELSPWNPRYVDETTWLLDENALLNDFAMLAGLTHDETKKLLEAVPDVDTWRLIHGKDTLHLVLIALRALFAHTTSNKRSLLVNLRISYRSQGCLAKTNLWTAIKAWQDHTGMVVITPHT